MAIKKEVRQKVYEKYDGHCAYCGRKIEYKDMQVDHLVPQMLVSYSKDISVWETVSSYENLMPSCRMCNHYKRANGLEVFRRYITEIPEKLRNDYIYKVGIVYGNVVENKKPIQFYFETAEPKE